MIPVSKLQNKPKSKHTGILETAKEISGFALTEASANDTTDSFPSGTFKKLSDSGIMQSVFPAKFGGTGLGCEAETTLELLILLKSLGYGNLVVGRIFEGHFNAVQLITEYGSAEQIKRFSNESEKENHIFGVWNTQAAGGVEIISLGDGKFRLEGSKTFASGTDYVNRPLITGKTADGGWQMCIVPMNEVKTVVDPSWWQPMGMKSSRSFRVDFTGVEITENELIGKPGDYYKQPFFSGGAIRFAAVQLGAAELLFDQTRKFLQELNRTDDPFQQMRLGEMAIAIESGNLWLNKSAGIFNDYLIDRDPAKIEIALNYVGMMRTAIEQICQDVMLRCERSIGSRGLLKPYLFERVIRDLTTYLRQAAPDATLTGVGKYVLQCETVAENLWRKEND